MELQSKPASRVPLHHASRAVLLAAAGWLAVYLAARLVLENMRDESVFGVWIAIAPVFAFFAFVGVVQRALRDADELQRLIQLQALALAFSSTTCVLMGIGLLDIAHHGRLEFPPMPDWWAMLPALYALCLLVTHWRYR
jgi:hypothetical protein